MSPESKKYKNKELLYNEYIINGLSTVQIGKMLNVSHRTIFVWLLKHNIKTRTNSEARSIKTKKELKNKEWLYQKYVIEKKSCFEIGNLLNCCSGTIDYWLYKHNISLRTVKEANKNLFKSNINNPM